MKSIEKIKAFFKKIFTEIMEEKQMYFDLKKWMDKRHSEKFGTK
jgi:hypothetical protein